MRARVTRTDAVAVALVLVSLASAAGAVTAPARAAAAGEQAVTARDAAVIERDQAVQSAEGDYGQAVAVADAAHGRAVAAARGDRESEYQAAVRDRDAAVADLGKIADPSRESVRERGDKYAQRCADVSSANPIKNAPPSPIKVDVTWAWMMAEVDPADEGRCREAGDERIAADLAEARSDVAARRKALAAVRDENAKTIAQIDKAAGPAIQQAGQDRGQAVAQAQAQRDAAVQAAEAQSAPVIAAAEEGIAAAEDSQTGTVIALWLAAVVAAAGAVWLGRRRLAQVPVRRAGGALTAAAVWLVQGWARAATWAMQQRRGGRLGRAFESATVSGLQAGAFAPAELLKGSAMSHGWDTSKPQKAVSGVRIAVLVSVLTMAGMAIATRLGAPAEATVAETGLVGFSYFVSHLVPLSWVVFGGPVAAVAAAGIGHALPLDAPMPAPAPGHGQPVTAGPDGPGDPLFKSLKPAMQTAFGAYLTPATVTTIRGGERHTWRLPPGLDADHVDTKVLRSHMSPLGVSVKVSMRHEQTVAVDVLECDPKDLPAIAWDAPRRSNFRSPMPVGETATGRKVTLDLEGARVAVIAKSNHGKTYLARMLALWAAQDPQVDLRVASLKGDPKLALLKACASEYTGRKDLEAAERMVIRVSDEVTRRNVEAEDDEQGREAIDIFGPLVLFVDEVHNITSKAGRAALEHIASEGRQAGVSIIVATQESKKESLPSRLLINCTTRFVGNFGDAEYPRTMMGVPASVRTDNLVQGQWVLQRENESDWATFMAAYVEDPEAAERAEAAAAVRAEHMPVVAQDVLPEAAAEAEPGCKRCGDPVPAGKANGFCSDRCRMAYKRSRREAVNRA